jgi:DNA-binding NtrC family response regulator
MEQKPKHHPVASFPLNGRSGEHWIAGMSPSMRAVESVLQELGHSLVPVLLIGEKGTGKRHTARRIHHLSGGLEHQFLVFNCAEIASQGFCHRDLKSASTLYFAEIGELSLDGQGELLEILGKQDGNESKPHHPRVICGSSHDLDTKVRGGDLREDLYYRLSGVCLRIPPLRQRKEDLPQLIQFFLLKYGEIFGRPVPALSPEIQEVFLRHSWPGNLEDLDAAARAMVALGDETVAMGGLRLLLSRPEPLPDDEKVSLKETARAASREAERELILKVLTRTRWNRRRAAQQLQISYKALLYKLKQIGYGRYETT